MTPKGKEKPLNSGGNVTDSKYGQKGGTIVPRNRPGPPGRTDSGQITVDVTRNGVPRKRL